MGILFPPFSLKKNFDFQ